MCCAAIVSWLVGCVDVQSEIHFNVCSYNGSWSLCRKSSITRVMQLSYLPEGIVCMWYSQTLAMCQRGFLHLGICYVLMAKLRQPSFGVNSYMYTNIISAVMRD